MVRGGCTLRSILYSTYCKCVRTVYTSIYCTHSYHAIESRSPIKISDDVVMMGDEKIENPMVMGERRRQNFTIEGERKKEASSAC